MKNIFFRSALCGLLLAASIGWLRVAGPSQQLPENVMRLHIIAHSNRPEDQALKLLVRDAVLEEASRWCQNARSLQEANTLLCTHLESIGDAAQHTIKENGFTDRATASVTEEYFPTRRYNGFTLPAGRYRALRVVIGEGAGRNWWCMVFPSLCLPAAAEGAKVLDSLPESQRAVAQGQEEIAVSLKLFEWYEELKNWLSGS